MKRVLAFCLGLLAVAMAGLTMTATAGAWVTHPHAAVGPNGESPDPSMTLAARTGSLYKSGYIPANWRINVEMHTPYIPPPPGDPQPDVAPLKEIDLKLPTDMTFNPKPNMPVCTDKKMNEATDLNITPMDAIKLCPKSVIGNGTAKLFISHKNTPTGPNINDPTLIVFNAGRVASGPQKGRPMIKIHGYSKATTAGIFMRGILEKSGRLDIKVPRLSNDSGVSQFDLNIPGAAPIKYNNKTVWESVGQDPNYLRAKCSTGNWVVDSVFILGMRDDASADSSDTWPVIAPQLNVPCTGKPGNPPATGKAKVGKVTVKGPASAKKGKKVTFKVTVKNTGSATATGVKVTASGKGAKGSANVGSIAKGKSKTVKVKVKFTKKGKSKVSFTAKSKNGGSKKAVKTVKVK
ncbi:MAG: hypothetical protein M9938_04850 [Solirubrobacterales bacterium]|nr:hypothetical protein [Solirubrobacterales bacterium]